MTTYSELADVYPLTLEELKSVHAAMTEKAVALDPPATIVAALARAAARVERAEVLRDRLHSESASAAPSERDPLHAGERSRGLVGPTADAPGVTRESVRAAERLADEAVVNAVFHVLLAFEDVDGDGLEAELLAPYLEVQRRAAGAHARAPWGKVGATDALPESPEIAVPVDTADLPVT